MVVGGLAFLQAEVLVLDLVHLGDVLLQLLLRGYDLGFEAAVEAVQGMEFVPVLMDLLQRL